MRGQQGQKGRVGQGKVTEREKFQSQGWSLSSIHTSNKGPVIIFNSIMELNCKMRNMTIYQNQTPAGFKFSNEFDLDPQPFSFSDVTWLILKLWVYSTVCFGFRSLSWAHDTYWAATVRDLVLNLRQLIQASVPGEMTRYSCSSYIQ